MRFAPIPPTDLLEQPGNTFHLCLAHVLDRDAEQVRFYRQRSASLDDYVILDNGAYELGASFQFEHVLKIAEEIIPDEIVLPDVFLNKAGTIIEAVKGFEMLSKQSAFEQCNLMVAPQGRNTLEWVECFEYLVSAVHPDVIGIPVVYESMMGRGILIEKVARLFNNKGYQPKIHLLGWDGDLYKLNCYARDYRCLVRGADSAKPYYFSQKSNPQVLFSGEPIKRPDNYFTLPYRAFDEDFIHRNLNLVYSAAEGRLDIF